MPELANTRLIALLEQRGWAPSSNPHHALVVTAETVAGWSIADATGIRPAVAADIESIRRMHDAEFPDTHTPADRLLSKMSASSSRAR